MDYLDTQENYYALAVAILKSCTPETAFRILDSAHPDTVKPEITEADAADMKYLKGQGMTYQEIGEAYGISMDAAFYHIRRGKEWAREVNAKRYRKGAERVG